MTEVELQIKNLEKRVKYIIGVLEVCEVQLYESRILVDGLIKHYESIVEECHFIPTDSVLNKLVQIQALLTKSKQQLPNHKTQD